MTGVSSPFERLESKHNESQRTSGFSFGPSRVITGVLLTAFVCSGCGPDRHVNALKDSPSGGRKFMAALALRDHFKHKRATLALIQALKDPKPAVRYAAAASLETHFRCMRADHALRKSALLALVDVLEDADIGRVSVPAFGPLLPGVSGSTPSPRSRALLTLSKVMGEDYGLNKEAWRQGIERRFP